MAHEEDTYSTLFSVLKHPIRRRILRMLNAKPYTYTEILAVLNVETGFLNYHLEQMRELIVKDERGRYGLSVFGEAAVGLIAQVEEPAKRDEKAVRVVGVSLTMTHLLAMALVALSVCNIYYFSAYQGLYRDRTNALGGIMFQTRGLLSEANNVLNHTLANGMIDFELWQVMLRNMALQLRLYATIAELDPGHMQQWTQMRSAIDEVTTLFFHIDQKYEPMSGRYLNLTNPQASSLRDLLEGLLVIEERGFPKEIILGAIPQIRVDEEDLTQAVEAAVDIQDGAQYARIEFDLWSGDL